MAMIAEALGQPPLELTPALLDLVEQLLVGDDPLYFQRRRAGERMGQISVAMLERARALPDGVDHAGRREHRTNRLITAAQALGDRLDVGGNAFLLPRIERARAAHAAHHLIEDQKRAMPVANVANRTEITLRRGDRAAG